MDPSGDTAPPRRTARAALAQVAEEFREFEPYGGTDAEPYGGTDAEPYGGTDAEPYGGTDAEVCGGAEEPSSDGDGPLGWPGYGAARQRAAARTGERESVVCGTGRVAGVEAVLLSFEFGYLGGSLGERTGARIEAAHRTARARRLPVVSIVATGGSRMQEGMRALVQLQRVARQTSLTRRAGLAQLAVVRDPTTGGGWATLAAAADVVLALPGAQAAFAGSRVRPAGADPAAYTAEAQHAAGHLDQLVPEAALGRAVGRWLALLTGGGPAPEPAPVPYALPATDGPGAAAAGALPRTGGEAVARARAAGPPRAEAYLDAYFDDREEISGDRCSGTDPGMRCGFGRHAGRTVAFAAQCGTPTRPAGYRTAVRLLRTADRLGIPVLTLIDTPGAANGPEDERAGTGGAVAETFAAVAETGVPVTSLLIGEGGSGGALALAAPERLWTTPDSYFSVIAPESAAAVLKRGPDRVAETAESLRLRPQDAVTLGVARGVAPPAP
ncbi:carboxyl transferase domain-containing protein [Streptomyces cacaoi]|uniref:carboxyl transferase domain-containing protein n=3 Tax=Streptomyces cacaoi TaxID=1898 RepID=UPI001F2B8038|nr:carboxyl transferase domain-containing protein [Streptomyces cacaoi]